MERKTPGYAGGLKSSTYAQKENLPMTGQKQVRQPFTSCIKGR